MAPKKVNQLTIVCVAEASSSACFAARSVSIVRTVGSGSIGCGAGRALTAHARRVAPWRPLLSPFDRAVSVAFNYPNTAPPHHFVVN